MVLELRLSYAFNILHFQCPILHLGHANFQVLEYATVVTFLNNIPIPLVLLFNVCDFPD